MSLNLKALRIIIESTLMNDCLIIQLLLKKETEIRHGRHCVFNLHLHLVFVTKYRRNVFTKEILEDLKLIFHDICVDFEAHLIEFDGEHDHVHLLINYPPKVAISRLVNSLKGVSSRMIRKKHCLQKNDPSIKSKLWGNQLWSPSYFAGSCGGAPISISNQFETLIASYYRNQLFNFSKP